MFLDPECKGTVSLEGLRRAVGSNASVYGKTEALLRSASEVVRAIAEQVIEGGLSPKGEFERVDEEMSGKLTLPAAARLLHKLAPDLSADERTAAHAYLYFCDFERTGVYSFAQLMQAFGVVRLLVERSEREKRVLARRKSRASMRNLVAASTEEVVWKLVAERIKGEPFWVDRETNLVYRPPPGGASGGQWPELYGKLTGVDMINANYMPQDLFQGLDRYLKVTGHPAPPPLNPSRPPCHPATAALVPVAANLACYPWGARCRNPTQSSSTWPWRSNLVCHGSYTSAGTRSII